MDDFGPDGMTERTRFDGWVFIIFSVIMLIYIGVKVWH